MSSQRKTSAVLRDKAVRSLQLYVSETLTYIDAVQRFSDGQKAGDWRLERKAELSTLKEITKLENKDEQQKLDSVLRNFLEGMEELSEFLDAVEKLAITSLHVFTGGEEVVKMSLGIHLQSVQDIVSAARLVCPLLLRFKRDAGLFFQPSLHNVAIYEAELDKYINTAEKICKTMETSSAVVFEDRRGEPPLVQFSEDLTSNVMQNIIAHVDQLSDIRKDQNFRLVYLFQEKSISGFVNQFSECRPRMLQFLDDMEGCAVQLDRMKMGSKISSVAGSSVGAIGGVLAIVGLALAPVTAGVSLGLTLGGLGLGVTSGVSSVVTTVTEMAVNKTQQKRASEGLQSFMQDVDRIQECLGEVTNQREEPGGQVNWEAVKGAMKVAFGVGGIGWSSYTIHEARMAKGIPETAEQVAKGSVSKMAVGIASSALFIGLDIFTICKDSISLARGEQSDVSEFIRARAALLRSEVDCWRGIHDAGCIGVQKLESGKQVLLMSFGKKNDDARS